MPDAPKSPLGITCVLQPPHVMGSLPVFWLYRSERPHFGQEICLNHSLMLVLKTPHQKHFGSIPNRRSNQPVKPQRSVTPIRQIPR